MAPKLKRVLATLYPLVALLACGVVVDLRFRPCGEGPLWDKYQRVRPGMTTEEVGSILGSPLVEWRSSKGPEWIRWLCVDGDEVVSLKFGPTGSGVQGPWGVGESHYYLEKPRRKTMFERVANR